MEPEHLHFPKVTPHIIKPDETAIRRIFPFPHRRGVIEFSSKFRFTTKRARRQKPKDGKERKLASSERSEKKKGRSSGEREREKGKKFTQEFTTVPRPDNVRRGTKNKTKTSAHKRKHTNKNEIERSRNHAELSLYEGGTRQFATGLR